MNVTVLRHVNMEHASIIKAHTHASVLLTTNWYPLEMLVLVRVILITFCFSSVQFVFYFAQGIEVFIGTIIKI